MLKTLKITGKCKFLSDYPRQAKYNLRKTFTFDKGLNIILGPNGSGKSTLMKILKAWYGIDGFRYNTTGYWPSLDTPKEFKPTLNTDDKNILEIIKGTECDRDIQFGVDCDQFYGNVKESELNTIFNALCILNANSLSSGEQRMEAQNTLRGFLESKSWMRSMGQSFVSKLEDIKPVLFMDEPTLGMSPDIEMQFFEYMSQWAAAGFQIVICTNTPFCFRPDCTYIQLESGYISKQRQLLERAVENAKEVETIT